MENLIGKMDIPLRVLMIMINFISNINIKYIKHYFTHFNL